MSWKDGLSIKNGTRTWSFLLYYLERWYFFFPKIWSYSLDGKWKMMFLKKYMEIGYFLQIPQKDSLSKQKIALEYGLSCTIWKDGIFFRKIWYFFFGRKMKDNFSKEIHRIGYFLCICINVTNKILLFCKKHQRWFFPEKIHLKVIEIFYRILERVEQFFVVLRRPS